MWANTSGEQAANISATASAGLLSTALLHHHAGRLQEAASSYEQLLQQDPKQSDVLYFLGILAYQLGQGDASVQLIRSAIELNKTAAHYHHNLGKILMSQGKPLEAEECFQEAASHFPDYAGSSNRLDFGIPPIEGAENVILRKLAEYAQQKLGSKQFAEAEALFRCALSLKFVTVDVLHGLGLSLFHQRRVSEAEDVFRKAVSKCSSNVNLWNNLATTQQLLGDIAEAKQSFQRALELDPDNFETNYNLGNLYRKTFNLAAAINCYQKAIQSQNAENSSNAIRKNNSIRIQALTNLALTLNECGRVDESIRCYRQALSIYPQDAGLHYNLATTLLQNSLFLEAWSDYEWRWNMPGFSTQKRDFSCPLWTGEDLTGKSILLHAEQGLGDSIQFIRYVPLLASRGAKVFLEIQPSLTRLMESLEGVAQIIPQGDLLPKTDWHCPLLSLPRAFRTSVENIPAKVPYLKVEKQKHPLFTAHAEIKLLKVGLVWQGNSKHTLDAFRSIPFDILRPILETEGIRFYALQPEKLNYEFLATNLVDTSAHIADFADTASLLKHLDLVISVDTSVAHLAGALGVPVWILLPECRTDWRWLRNRNDSPWYPSARLFRQSNPGDWSSILLVLKEELTILKNASSDMAHRVFCLQKEQAQHPGSYNILGQLAAAYFEAGATESAIQCYKRCATESANSLHTDYRHARNLSMLGKFLEANNRKDEALLFIKQAINLGEESAETHWLLGNLLCQQEDYKAAVDQYRKSLDLSPKNTACLGNLGFALSKLKRHLEALANYRQIVALEPNSAQAWKSLALVEMDLGSFADASKSLCKALRIEESAAQNSSFDTKRDLALCLSENRQYDKAEALFQQLLREDPKHSFTHTNYGFFLLSQGRYLEGWAEHEWRWKAPDFPSKLRSFGRPLWKGEPLNGDRILIYWEQGFGDTIQFIRYIPLVAAKGGRVILEVQPALLNLLKQIPGVEQFLSPGDALPEFSWHCPLMSLPLAFGTTLDNIPTNPNYLSVAPDLVAKERKRFPRKGLRIGLVWAGSPTHTMDNFRSINLEQLALLAQVENATFFSLQVGAGVKQLEEVKDLFPIIDACSGFKDFAETAAFISTLDLVITVDTAVAHLSGAMGIPTWIMLPYHRSDWRWLKEGSKSNWYPSVRLFRQPHPGNWANVVSQIYEELTKNTPNTLRLIAQGAGAE